MQEAKDPPCRLICFGCSLDSAIVFTSAASKYILQLGHMQVQNFQRLFCLWYHFTHTMVFKFQYIFFFKAGTSQHRNAVDMEPIKGGSAIVCWILRSGLRSEPWIGWMRSRGGKPDLVCLILNENLGTPIIGHAKTILFDCSVWWPYNSPWTTSWLHLLCWHATKERPVRIRAFVAPVRTSVPHTMQP